MERLTEGDWVPGLDSVSRANCGHTGHVRMRQRMSCGRERG